MGVGSQCHTPATLPPRKETQYPLYKWLGGPQGQSRWVPKISPPPGGCGISHKHMKYTTHRIITAENTINNSYTVLWVVLTPKKFVYRVKKNLHLTIFLLLLQIVPSHS